MFKLFKNLSCGASAREPERGPDLTTSEAKEDYIRDMVEYLKLLKSPTGRNIFKNFHDTGVGFTQVEPFTGANKIIGYDEPVTLFAESGH